MRVTVRALNLEVINWMLLRAFIRPYLIGLFVQLRNREHTYQHQNSLNRQHKTQYLLALFVASAGSFMKMRNSSGLSGLP